MAFSTDENEPEGKGERGEEKEKSGRPWIVAAFAIIIVLLGLMFYGSIREFSVNSVPAGPQFDEQ